VRKGELWVNHKYGIKNEVPREDKEDYKKKKKK